MKSTLKVLGILFAFIAASFVYASDDSCQDCNTTNTCSNPPPGESMSIELGD